MNISNITNRSETLEVSFDEALSMIEHLSRCVASARKHKTTTFFSAPMIRDTKDGAVPSSLNIVVHGE